MSWWRRWLTGRAREADMRSVHLGFQAAIMAENWARAAEIADSDTKGYLWPGLKEVARQRRDEAYADKEWAQRYAVTRDVLSDDFYEQVNARRPLIDTLHDSTMMARIDKGEQAEADFPWWLDYRGSVAKPWICPDAPEPDPYVWHDVGTLVDMANEVGA